MKKFIAALAAAGLSALCFAQVTPSPEQYAAPTYLATNVTTSGAAVSVKGLNRDKTYQVTGATASGTGSAVVKVQGSNDNSSWDDIGTVTLTLGTTATSGSFKSGDRYAYVRANATTLTGTGATYTATIGY